MRFQTHPPVSGVIIGLAATAAALTMLPAPSAQAATVATVSSSPSAGVKFVGTDNSDKITFSRAGTISAPKIHFDADTPISIQAGCVAVGGDPTRALCDLPSINQQVKKISILGLGGDDLIAHGTGSAIPMIVNAGAGNDVVNGGPGLDEINGSTGNDTLRGGDNTDTLQGGSGNDTVEGGSGRDDNLFGGDGDDKLLGGDGDSDDLDGGRGADQLDGGPGKLDIVLYNTRSDPVFVDLSSTTADNGERDEGDRILTGVENAMGGAGGDILNGNDVDNNLIGRGGIDLIFGGKGKDVVLGGDGDDILGGNVLNLFTSLPNADGAEDQIAGEDGNDTCIRSAADPDLTVDCETVNIDG
jgi:Ca2+-binding RTX toxin-like protein